MVEVDIMEKAHNEMVANYEERIAVIENRVGIFCSIKR
jgi:hypothetical protein